jgi:ABC-2 type transport system ATP-binding protein
MIDVRQLSKSYGQIQAVSALNFSVGKGEVMGFLGPNGAGKTTTLRIICGCIGASEGSVVVAGHDVSTAPKAVKTEVGYLPERPPLYEDMVVRDYIIFAATIKGVRDPEAAADKVIATVGLDQPVGGQPAHRRIIGHLSKGFKQRVGLAQALVHDPRVLVLDEPTSGLDPAQRREIRELLAQLAQEGNRTIILSTHVLAEVEAICDKVIVICDGQIVASDSIDNLRGAGLRIQVSTPTAALATRLSALDGVDKVEAGKNGIYTLATTTDVRAEVAALASDHGLLSLDQEEGLEDIYLRLIGHSQ